jgi:hypothetical protein
MDLQKCRHPTPLRILLIEKAATVGFLTQIWTLRGSHRHFPAACQRTLQTLISIHLGPPDWPSCQIGLERASRQGHLVYFRWPRCREKPDLRVPAVQESLQSKSPNVMNQRAQCTSSQLYYDYIRTSGTLYRHCITTSLYHDYITTLSQLYHEYNTTSSGLHRYYITTSSNSTVTTLQLDHNSIMTTLQLQEHSIVTALQLHCNSTVTTLQLCWDFIGTTLHVHRTLL